MRCGVAMQVYSPACCMKGPRGGPVGMFLLPCPSLQLHLAPHPCPSSKFFLLQHRSQCISLLPTQGSGVQTSGASGFLRPVHLGWPVCPRLSHSSLGLPCSRCWAFGMGVTGVVWEETPHMFFANAHHGLGLLP